MVSTGSNCRSNVPRGKNVAVQCLSCASHRVRGSPQRVPAPLKVDDARSPISLHCSAHESRPGLFSIQGPSRGPSSTGGSTNVSRRWCQQGPSEGPASPLRPSRLEARLPLRPPSSSLGRITDVQVGSASLPADPTRCLLCSLLPKRLRARLENPAVPHTQHSFRSLLFSPWSREVNRCVGSAFSAGRFTTAFFLFSLASTRELLRHTRTPSSRRSPFSKLRAQTSRHEHSSSTACSFQTAKTQTVCEISFVSLPSTHDCLGHSLTKKPRPSRHFLSRPHPLALGHSSQPSRRGLFRNEEGIIAISRFTTIARTQKQSVTAPDTHISSHIPHNLSIHEFNGGTELILYLVLP